MTLFALACAGLFPLLHLGRPQYAFFLAPYPNTLAMWPQFVSPLVWTSSRSPSTPRCPCCSGTSGCSPTSPPCATPPITSGVAASTAIASLGWRNSAAHCTSTKRPSKIIAALCAPLVISVHSIVGLDFAYTILPGWHSTIFTPFFVVAPFSRASGWCLTLIVPIRWLYGLGNVITMTTSTTWPSCSCSWGMCVFFGHLSEYFMAWYSGDIYEAYEKTHEVLGYYAPVFYISMGCTFLAIQPLWSGAVRRRPFLLFVISILVNVGMWAEHYLNIVGSLHRDFLPSSWGEYHTTIWDWSTYIGTLGLFLTLLFLFLRFLPIVSMSEVRTLIHEENRP